MDAKTNTMKCAKNMLIQFGLDKQGWKVELDRAKQRCGCCYFYEKKITLSKHYIAAETVSNEDIKNTILHEIAHAIAGPDAGHGPRWKLLARAIGCSAERCNTAWRGAPKKFRLFCDCGAVRVERHRVHKSFRYKTCTHCKSLHVRKNV